MAEEKIAKARGKFTGRLGFVLAASASAIGLGNLWRFPYLAAKYGGGAFLLIYLIFVVTFGFALMVGEVALGRKTELSVMGAFRSFGKKFTFIGVLAALVPFIITPYYMLIGGWVTKYMVNYVTDGSAVIAADAKTYFTTSIINNPMSYVWFFIFFGITVAIVALGIKNGIERSNKFLMPVLILMSIAISIYALTLPGAMAGLKYFLVPDFSKFSIEMVISAMGQMFFSLSLAMGIMITYGSYFQKTENLERAVRNTEIFDTLIAMLAGLMIIPACFAVYGSGDAVAQNSGPGLMFVVLPQVFDKIGPFGSVIGFLFFALTFFAALTSAISLFETCVSIVSDSAHVSRKRSIVVCGIFIALLGLIVNMGYNNWVGVDPMYSIFGIGQLGDHQILDFFDFLSNTVMMPIVALLTCIFIGWVIKPESIIEEVEQDGVVFHGRKLFYVMIKYIAPIFTIMILIGYVLSTVGVITL